MGRTNRWTLAAVLCAAACGDERGEDMAGNDGLGPGDTDDAGSDDGQTDDGGQGSGSGTGGGNSGDESDGGAGGTTGGTDDDAPKFDIASPDAGEPDDCGEDDMGEVEFSYIWIANSPEGTVSKIDTQMAVEVARYRTSPNALGSPSRTSVNLHGDVAVLNREEGGVIKIAARIDDCVEQNGQPGIQTSSGPGDMLPFGQDECVLWSHPLPATYGENGGARALAWDAGQFSMDECDPEYRLWVGWRDASSVAKIRALDSDGNQVGADVDIPVWYSNFIVEGPYGGATDQNGDFWTIDTHGRVIHVDAVTFVPTAYEIGADGGGSGDQYYAPIYGVAVDANGDPWVAGFYSPAKLWRFDAVTRTFDAPITTSAQAQRGMAIDEDGIAWVAQGWSIAPAAPCALSKFDTTTGTLVSDNIVLPGCSEPVGVSIDFEGNVWVVDKGANQAYKLDPTTHAVLATVGGLVAPYTYSDMTGAGLKLVAPTG